MKVRDLTERLTKMDQDLEVIVQKDAEGNCFSPLVDLNEGAYLPVTKWYGEAALQMHTEPDQGKGYTGGNSVEKRQKAVFLQPAF